MSDIVSICRTAWQQTKKAHQPDYDDLVEAYRTMLTARAEGAIATGGASEDIPFQPFEKAVLDQPRPSEPEPIVDYNDDDSLGHEDEETLSPEVAQAEKERLERAARREAATKPEKKPVAKKKRATPKKVAVAKVTKKPAVKKAAKKIAPKK